MVIPNQSLSHRSPGRWRRFAT